MSPHYRISILSILAVFLSANRSLATEPNDTFAESTLLGLGVLSVTDDLTVGGSGDLPNTMIASLNSAGFITSFNDDGGPWDASLGSALRIVPINSDSSFWFIVTGNPDFNFAGNHDQSGNYHIYVDIYNDFGELEETFEFGETLEPGDVDQFYLDGFNTFYTYDVFIDNTVGGSGQADVDFFTFTGLTAGSTFTAEVTQEIFSGFNSYLGWFSDTGILLDTDDDDGVDTLSLLEGTVPASGKLTFAVTGFGDDDFLGAHVEDAAYTLELSLSGAATPGDYNQNGTVDAADYTVWRDNLGSGTSLPNDDTPGVGPDDYDRWKTHFGDLLSGSGGLPTGSLNHVPEPSALALLLVIGLGLTRRGLRVRASAT